MDVEPQGLSSDTAMRRGYVDILCTATEGSSTMNGEDFGALPRIADDCGVCASCLKVSLGSLFGNTFPGQTSMSRPRKPERRRADRLHRPEAVTAERRRPVRQK